MVEMKASTESQQQPQYSPAAVESYAELLQQVASMRTECRNLILLLKEAIPEAERPCERAEEVDAALQRLEWAINRCREEQTPQ